MRKANDVITKIGTDLTKSVNTEVLVAAMGYLDKESVEFKTLFKRLYDNAINNVLQQDRTMEQRSHRRQNSSDDRTVPTLGSNEENPSTEEQVNAVDAQEEEDEGNDVYGGVQVE